MEDIVSYKNLAVIKKKEGGKKKYSKIKFIQWGRSKFSKVRFLVFCTFFCKQQTYWDNMANQICRLKVKNWTNAAGTIKHLKRNRNVTSTSCRVCKQSHDICCVRTQQQHLCYRHLPPLLRPWFIVIWGIFEANSCLNRPDVATLCFLFFLSR